MFKSMLKEWTVYKNILNNSNLSPLYPWNIKAFIFLNKKAYKETDSIIRNGSIMLCIIFLQNLE